MDAKIKSVLAQKRSINLCYVVTLEVAVTKDELQQMLSQSNENQQIVIEVQKCN